MATSVTELPDAYYEVADGSVVELQYPWLQPQSTEVKIREVVGFNEKPWETVQTFIDADSGEAAVSILQNTLVVRLSEFVDYRRK